MADKLARAIAGLPQNNFTAAHKDLRLSPQEQDLYQRHLQNLWGPGGVDNSNGSRSSLYVANVQGPDGRAYNIPTVYDGQIVPVDQAMQKAGQQGWNTFPSYPTWQEADARYVDQMHPYMDKDTGTYMGIRRVDGAPLYPTLGDQSPQNAVLAQALARTR